MTSKSAWTRTLHLCSRRTQWSALPNGIHDRLSLYTMKQKDGGILSAAKLTYLLLRRVHALHHAAHVHLVIAGRNLEQGGVRLAFLNIGQLPG